MIYLSMTCPMCETIAVSHLVHLDVVPVELQPGHPILHICLPAHALRPEVEQLHVSVVIAGSQAAVLVGAGVSECNRPAVSGGLLPAKLLEKENSDAEGRCVERKRARRPELHGLETRVDRCPSAVVKQPTHSSDRVDDLSNLIDSTPGLGPSI